MTAATTPASTSTTVARSELARALRAAASVRSEAVIVTIGDDLTIAAHTPEVAVSVALDAPAGEADEIAVGRTRLAGILPYCDGEITLSIADGTLTLVSGCSEFEIPALRDKERFGHPSRGEQTGDTLEIEAPVFVETLRRALPFVSRDETRPILCHVALYPAENIAVATDSYRLTVVRYGDDGPREDPILLRKEAADSMRRLLAKTLGTVEIVTGDDYYTARFGDLEWTMKRPKPYKVKDRQAVFPDWRKLLPEDDPVTTIKVDRDDLLCASRAAATIASRNEPLRLNLTKKVATVTSGNKRLTGRMSRRLSSAGVTGEKMEVGFNPDFLADICAVAPVERLTLKAIGPLRPLLVEAARDRYLLMPIRLNV